MGKTYTLELSQLPDDEKHIRLIVKLTIRDETTKEEIDYRYMCSCLYQTAPITSLTISFGI